MPADLEPAFAPAAVAMGNTSQSRPTPCDQMPRASWDLRAIVCLFLLLQSCAPATVSADTREDFETLAVPFPFYNEAFGFAAGYVSGDMEN